MKHKGYDEKRKKIIEAADILFHDKGFDNTSIDDILKEVKISRGTFYHYFGSKIELLDAIIQTLVVKFIDSFTKIVADENLNAIDKLRSLFKVGDNIESREKTIMLQILQIYFKEENLIYRKRMHDRFLKLLTPLYAQVLKQGMEEGVLTVINPEETASFLIQSFDIIRNTNVQEILSDNPDPERISDRVSMFMRYFEKMLGIEPDTFRHMSSECFGEMITKIKQYK